LSHCVAFCYHVTLYCGATVRYVVLSYCVVYVNCREIMFSVHLHDTFVDNYWCFVVVLCGIVVRASASHLRDRLSEESVNVLPNVVGFLGYILGYCHVTEKR
jgi:hypothetical protein